MSPVAGRPRNKPGGEGPAQKAYTNPKRGPGGWRVLIYAEARRARRRGQPIFRSDRGPRAQPFWRDFPLRALHLRRISREDGEEGAPTPALEGTAAPQWSVASSHARVCHAETLVHTLYSVLTACGVLKAVPPGGPPEEEPPGQAAPVHLLTMLSEPSRVRKLEGLPCPTRR